MLLRNDLDVFFWSEVNPWNAKQKVDHLNHMLVIKKDNKGKSVEKFFIFDNFWQGA